MDHTPLRHVFVIKVWRDDERGADAWQASALHVDSGRRLVSTDLRDVVAFVRRSVHGTRRKRAR